MTAQKKCKECDTPVETTAAKASFEKYGGIYCIECRRKIDADEQLPSEEVESAPSAPPKEPAQQTYHVGDGGGDDVPFVEHPDVAEAEIVQYNQQAATAITQYTPKQIETIKNTVAKGISNSELEMFMHLCQVYGLDPFLKEIFYSANMKTIMTSRDGYLKVAQRDQTFDGIQSMAVCENDEFEIDAVTPTVNHKFGKGDRGKVIGAWAIVHKKGRRAVISYADIREYKKDTSVWKTYESAMICKVAEAFSLKRQFGISGLVTQEEIE